MGLIIGNGIGIPFNKQSELLSSYWAKRFTDAAGITDATEKSALRVFVSDLLAINSVQPNFVNFDTPADSICLAIYPFAGTTASQQKFNLINPADTDAAYRLTFGGGMTHNANGIKGNGTNATCRTHILCSALGAASHGADVFMMGAQDADGRYVLINGGSLYFYVKSGGIINDGNAAIQGCSLNQATYNNSLNRWNSCGLVNINRTSINEEGLNCFYGQIKDSSTTPATTGTLHNSEIQFLYGRGSYSKNGLQFASIRKSGVSDIVIGLFNDAIIKFLNAIGRLPKNNIVFEGHSFFAFTGIFPHTTTGVVIKLNDSYDDRIYRYVNSAVSGAVIDDLIARKSTAVDPYKITDYGIRNIVPLWIGINDITAGTPGATVYAKVKSYYNSLVADGWIPVVLTACETAGGVGETETRRNDFNNLLRADTDITYLIDCDDTTELSDSTNTTYFNKDQLHLTSAGALIAADLIVNKIKTIV